MTDNDIKVLIIKMRAALKEMKNNKEKAKLLLIDAGIYTECGDLAEVYKNQGEYDSKR